MALKVNRSPGRISWDLDACAELPRCTGSGAPESKDHPEGSSRVSPRDATLVATKVHRDHRPGLGPSRRAAIIGISEAAAQVTKENGLTLFTVGHHRDYYN